MEKNGFGREIADMILSAVKDPSAKGRVSRMTSIGHFNGRVFNPEKFVMQNFLMIVRIFVNLAMEMDHKQFIQLCLEIAERICQIAENHGDAFNNAHKRIIS